MGRFEGVERRASRVLVMLVLLGTALPSLLLIVCITALGMLVCDTTTETCFSLLADLQERVFLSTPSPFSKSESRNRRGKL